MALRDQIKVPKLVRLYDYWDIKRMGRRYPSRHDIEPTEMAFILGNLDLVEVSGDPLAFTFRVSGSVIDRDEGFNMQGKTLDDYPLPEYREAIRKTYTRAVISGEPNYEELDRECRGKLLHYARLTLPLSRDASRVDMLLLGRVAIRPRILAAGLAA